MGYLTTDKKKVTAKTLLEMKAALLEVDIYQQQKKII